MKEERTFEMFKIFIFILFLSIPTFSKALYVAMSNGSDSYTYEECNITHPWKTFAHGVYRVKAGDTLYVRSGTYPQSYRINIRWDYGRIHDGGDPNEQVLCETGTAAKPVVIRNYPGETPVIDCAPLGLPYLIEHDGKAYWTWIGLKFINIDIVFYVGNNAYSPHNSFKNLIIERNAGGDNHGGITFVNGNADYLLVDGCTFIGPGTTGVHQNTCGIYLKEVENAIITNNRISTCPIGIYYKHRNVGTSSTNIIIAYNYMTNNNRNSMNLNCNRAYIHDNIINSTNIFCNNANGAPGGDYNRFEHNTFANGGLALLPATQSGDPLPGAISNTIKNNVFKNGTLYLHNGSNLPHYTTMDYNGYNTGTIFKTGSPETSRSFSAWRSFYGQDQHSIEGNVLFKSSSPSSIADFELASNSIGNNAASDGKDMGADISLFGVEIPPDTTDTTEIPDDTTEIDTTLPERELWSSHPEWIWFEDFELSTFDPNDYEDYTNNYNAFAPSTESSYEGFASLRQLYTVGQVNAGYIIKYNASGFPDHLFMRFYHKFPSGFSGYPPKMARMRNRNWSTWESPFEVHIWIKDDGRMFSDVKTPSGWLPEAISSYVIPKGVWVCYEMELKLNTLGQQDGIVRIWANDTLRIERLNVDIRGSQNLPINEVELDCYWNSGSPAIQSRYFDNYIISTEKIGLKQASSTIIPPTIDLSDLSPVSPKVLKPLIINGIKTYDTLYFNSVIMDDILSSTDTSRTINVSGITRGYYWLKVVNPAGRDSVRIYTKKPQIDTIFISK
jgi:hypothetical protein